MVWTTKPPVGIQLDFTNPINNGLVGCWIFNEGSGTVVNDLSTNGNNGTLMNIAEPSTATSGWNMNGRLSGIGLSLDGIDDYVELGNKSSIINFTLTNEITISAWVYINSKSTTNSEAIISCLGGLSGYAIRIGTSYTSFFIGDGTTYVINYGNPFPTNSWHHVVAIKSGTSMRLYVDNILLITNVFNGTISTQSSGYTVRIGSNQLEGNKCINGIIDDVRIWNRGLSNNEINILNTNSYGMFIDSRICSQLICDLNVI